VKSFKTHYDNLKVSWDAPQEVINGAYKALVNKYHPDRNPNCERSLRAMQAINVSYEVLSDPEKRKAHDAWIKEKLAEGAAQRAISSARVAARAPQPQYQAWPKPTKRRPVPPPTKRQYGSGVRLLILLAIGACGGLYIYLKKNMPPSRFKHSVLPPSGIFAQPPSSLPPNGETTLVSPHESKAPLIISTEAGANYVVKLKDAGTGKDTLMVFVHGGTTAVVKVPLGTYILKYAMGTQWYGYDYLFGPGTRFFQAETPISFSQQSGAQTEQRLAVLNRDLAASDAEFRSFLISKGLKDDAAAVIFDETDADTQLHGLDRFNKAEWERNVLPKIKDPFLHNAIIERVSEREKIVAARDQLIGRIPGFGGCRVTLSRASERSMRAIRSEEF